VLVRADRITFRVCDLEELDRARRTGLILRAEARGAQDGLAALTSIIERGDANAQVGGRSGTALPAPGLAVPGG
jgi:hypothetical protein